MHMMMIIIVIIIIPIKRMGILSTKHFSRKIKVVPYSITSVGLGADPGFVAVSPQVILVTNPVVGYRYFPPGPRLLSQPKISTPLADTKLYCLVSVTEALRV